MKSLQRFAVCIAAFVALSGQTPAPQTPTSSTPVRHLAYAFQVDYITNGEGHSSGMSDGGMGGVGSGVGSMLGGGGRRGTIDVDVIGFSPDGALIVGVNEMLQSAPRPSERFTCTVYGDGHVMCPTADGPRLSDAENLLLSFLGRGFIDPNALDAHNHWQRSYNGKDVNVVTDYTLTDQGDGRPAIVAKHSKITSRVPTVGDSVEDARIVYDRALSVPDSVHDTMDESFTDGSLQTTFDITLTSDSFAKH